MEDTTNTELGNGTETVENQERTFTQSELDDILKSRLAKERAKYANYEELQSKALKFDEMEEANKTELQKATEKAEALQKQIDAMNAENEIRTIREKVSKDTGVPASLLNGSSEENCMEQAYAILAYKNENSAKYPTVKDGGEAHVTTQAKSNGQMFGDWLSEQLNN